MAVTCVPARRLASLCLWLLVAWIGSSGTTLAQVVAEIRPEPAVVTLRDAPVFSLERGDGSLSAVDRARAAGRALAEAASAPTAHAARWETRGTRAVVFVGATQIVGLTLDDALAANAASLEALASHVTREVDKAVTHERQRTSLANTVFAVSLVVFFGLITLYLMGRLRSFCDRARGFLLQNSSRVPALRLNKLEVLGPASVRNALILVLGVGRVLGLLGLGYAWLVVSLSLFERTRPLVQRLTGVILTPLSALVARVALALPMLVIAVVAVALIAILVRVTELFFASVERGETRITWLPPEFAYATSVLVRGAIVVMALLSAGPILTGDQNGPISRGSLVVLACIALAATPLLCSLMAGMATVFSRTLRVGDRVEYGGQTGRVSEVGLLYLVLEDEAHASVRVPHVRSLWYATRIYPRELP